MDCKVADFGVAVRCPVDCFVKGSGTVPYMSPEQLKDSCNVACDVWACGCVFFVLVCGCSLVPSECWEQAAKAHEFMFSHGFGDKLRMFDGKCGSVVGADVDSAVEARALVRGLLHRAWENRFSATEGGLRNGFLKRCQC